ncbi:MAG: hypothetical protein A3A86_06905 [Elusimicrobia bacterium RIFCSPLOWO2_01_FULL_60_11]|nr:MAG: hypothetical protein A3A86_06905 [Elusimicrobia bacterium RIFCSPLOWO2_01_FULL_60_11]
MKAFKTLLCLTALSAMQAPIQAETPVQAPLYQVAIVQSPAKAINYRNLKGFVMIDLKGTVLIPNAQGSAEIRNKAGTMSVKARFENLTPPSQFGREYLTYVLWAISPDGRASNLGELIVKNGKSNLKATTPLQAMSLIVTAEPYFAVSQPGNVVVMENAIRKGTTAKIESIDAKYELLAKGSYVLHMSQSDEARPMDVKTPFVVTQARNAVSIAKAAGAETYAVAEFNNAQTLLGKAENTKGGKKSRNMTAREAVQSAEASRLIAVKTQAELALGTERRISQDQIANSKNKASEAAKGQEAAEAARTSAEIAKDKSDMEVKDVKLQAEKEKAALRAQLFAQFNLILQTRDTARGLVVNMSDVLFRTGSNELRPNVREKLAKLAGIVLAYPGLKLEMEGHTDNVGGDSYNQDLSEKRAQTVRDYLVNQGVPSNSIVSRGFGKTQPMNSNATAEGRQMNRRVEMVVTGESIGS